jgi:hypothetical protein
LERKKWCCALIWAVVKKSANYNSEGIYWSAITWSYTLARTNEASMPICLMSSCLTGSRAILITHVLSDKRVVGVVTETPKFASNHTNHVTSAVQRAIACNLASALEQETMVCFFIF